MLLSCRVWFGALFRFTIPYPPQATTISARERFRKARLLGIAIVSLFLAGIAAFIGALFGGTQQGIALVFSFLLLLILVAVDNHRGHLYRAGTLFIVGFMGLASLGIILTATPASIDIVWSWMPLALVPIIAGLALPFWAPLLFGGIDILLVSTLLIHYFQKDMLTLIPHTDQIALLGFVVFFIGAIGALTAIYAHSVEKAVIEADRAVELEQAHTALSEAYTRLEDLATRDPLTGLLNQRALHAQLPAVVNIAACAGQPLAVIFADLDHFKQVNDTWGHQIGDLALTHLAGCLRTHVRATDIVARYGGEEFVIVLPDHNHNDAQQMAERLRASVATTPLSLPDGKELSFTLSLGVAILPDDGLTIEEILIAADTAMYHAKHSGRNRVCLAATHSNSAA